MKRKQRTIATEVSISGPGIHTGVPCTLAFRPAAAGAGVTLHLKNGAESTAIPVNSSTTGFGLHRTVAKSVTGVEVGTVEHMLAAVYGLGVDNLNIDLTAPEPPAAGGCAAEFAAALQKAGIVELEAEAKPFVLTRPVAVSDGKGGSISAFPCADGLRLSYSLHYPDCAAAQGFFEAEITPDKFLAEVAPARTFCPEAHAEKMRAAGCGLGANYDNTLVLRADGPIDTKLRFPNEPVRHKVLDLLGDLAPVGRPLEMSVSAVRGGHELNAAFVKALEREIFRSENPKGVLDIRNIEATLPHRYPFLLVDRILEMEKGKRIVSLKNVTRNEEFFEGHFPGQPVMPGVLQIEAMAQTGCVLMMWSLPEGERKLAVLMSIDGVKYRRPVVPGDQLIMEVEIEKCKGRIGQVKAMSYVDGEPATEATIKFALVDAKSYT